MQFDFAPAAPYTWRLEKEPARFVGRAGNRDVCMRHLKTYLQVSDLHFTGGLHEKWFDPWAQHVPGLRGFVGHTVSVLRSLQATFIRLSENEPGLELIVTGDLTAFGAASQFSAADHFFGGYSITFPFLGLHRPEWATLSVPGNHDFWSGVACTGWSFTNAEVRKRYPLDAWATPALPLPGGRELVFLHLNGEADVRALSPERMYACGSFRSAVEKLDALLDQRRNQEVRVLLLHHSVQHEGEPVSVPGSRWLPVEVTVLLKHLSIDDASKAALAALVAKHDIRLILTGHIHHPPFLGRITTAAFAAGPPCWESCCGSTTQRCLPSTPGLFSDNGLIVHRVESDTSGAVFWRSEVYALFAHASRPPEFRPMPPPAPPDTSLFVRLCP
jgi:calcineurin-like phosphoesterase family protein